MPIRGMTGFARVSRSTVFKALDAVGFAGYITAFGVFSVFATPEEAAERSYRYLMPLVEN